MRFTRQDFEASDGRLVSRAEIARLAHERWLNKALELEKAGVPIPSIPTRAERDGGFSLLMSTSLGRAWARAWWETTLGAPEVEF